MGNIPIPSPADDETKADFISRCVSAISDEYPNDQAVAICMNKWGEKLKERMEQDAKWKFVAEADACELCQYYHGDEFETSEIWDEFPYAMPLFDNVIEPNIHPNCRCQLLLIEESLRRTEMHKDFAKILDGFDDYYCKDGSGCEQGTAEFNTWISDLGLDINKSYGQSQEKKHEAFVWAKDMISLFKKDEENTYWKILFAFPWESMNGNLYTEEEIDNSVKTIVGKSPSLNHWDDTRKTFEEGGVKYVGAEYEDGACEAILKSPNEFVCPMCGNGKTLNYLIENKLIVNVSLEASCELVGPGNSCIGLEFNAPTLLTSDTLPGIPMARIFPLEKVMSEALAHKRGGKRLEIKVEGLGEAAILPDANGQCPEGMILNGTTGVCEQDTDCPDGQHWDAAVGACVADEKGPPEGTTVDLGVPASSDTSKKPIEAMTEDEIKDKIAAIQKQIDDSYGYVEPSSTDYAAMEPLYAELQGYKDALAALIKQKALAPEALLADPGAGKDLGSIDCPDGQIWDQALGKCVTPEAPPVVIDQPVNEAADLSGTDLGLNKCPEGQVWDPDLGKCVMGPTTPPKTVDQDITDAPPLIDAGAPQQVNAALELTVSELKLLNLQTDNKFKSAEEQIAYLQNQNKELIVEKININAVLKASEKTALSLQATIDKRDKSLIEKDKVIARKDMAMEKMVNDHTDALENADLRATVTSNARDQYKTLLDELRPDYEKLDTSYNKQLEINLAQTRKLTAQNEKMVEKEEEVSELRQKLKKAKRNAKVIVQM